MEGAVIQDDITVLLSIKEKTRPRYGKLWEEFKQFSDRDFAEKVPAEDDILKYIRFLREDRKLASSSVWTCYSMLNSVIKSKYGLSLKAYVRVTTLIKSYDTDVKRKAKVFIKEDFDRFLAAQDLGTPYWLVRKVILKLY